VTYSCPTCGEPFDTRRGLGVHHSPSHDERLPNRTCDQCGESFYCDYARTYCSEECLECGQSFEGSSNPNYQGKKQTTTCDPCGSEFEYYPSEKEGIYCPECVGNADWQDPPSLEGEDNPHWSGGTEETACTVCGAKVERHPSELDGDATLCSEACRREWLSEVFCGDGHPNWDGGGLGDYGTGWNRVRREALKRDGHECAVCGATKEDLGRNPDVHHIVPVRSFVESELLDAEDARYLKNVIALCASYHRKAEFDTLSAEFLRSQIDDD
jgi:DNA-directed RNA polymerase subunit RPC12/RpoP